MSSTLPAHYLQEGESFRQCWATFALVLRPAACLYPHVAIVTVVHEWVNSIWFCIHVCGGDSSGNNVALADGGILSWNTFWNYQFKMRLRNWVPHRLIDICIHSVHFICGSALAGAKTRYYLQIHSHETSHLLCLKSTTNNRWSGPDSRNNTLC